MGKVNNILFVCTSNACRSVMAELIMGKLLEKKHISEVQVRSRGLVALFPEPVLQKAEVVIEKNGLAAGGHCAKQLAQEDIEWADLIFTMSEEQRQKVIDEFENVFELVYGIDTMKHFVEESGDVLDPYGKDVIDYEYCFREIERLVEKIWNKIEEEYQ